jgi:hypothetical protein
MGAPAGARSGTPMPWDLPPRTLSMADWRRAGSPISRVAFALTGLGIVGWAVATSAPFYAGSFALGVLVISAIPYVLYLAWVRGLKATVITGIALVGSTLWTYVSFALVPASSRDGVEGLWILLGLALNFLAVVLGALADRASSVSSREIQPGSPNR